jgi:hypothetical protein
MKRVRQRNSISYQDNDRTSAVSRNLQSVPSYGAGRKLQSRRMLTIDDGDYRVFISVFCKGQQLSFGFPKGHCRNQKVWVGRDFELVCWLSIADARANLGSLFNSQCQHVLAQCGQCDKVISTWKTPIVLAKRLLGAYKKV